MVNPVEVLELLKDVEVGDPLDLSSLGSYEPLVRVDVVVALCDNWRSADLPEALDREAVLMSIVARLVLDNLRLNVKDLEESRAALAAQDLLSKYRA
jgi:hypothetical protein